MLEARDEVEKEIWWNQEEVILMPDIKTGINKDAYIKRSTRILCLTIAIKEVVESKATNR
ncbi:hypothetical protein H5410_051991 [Solanum commersonii]|uniref:Uncharacterized protein n=1 Tax=Solanum commersonii TaxID=4109 RepID=A0A9J5X243_SOLCO|nr:hypothetical protein H5410_051991 [Solanum commersonii]